MTEAKPKPDIVWAQTDLYQRTEGNKNRIKNKRTRLSRRVDSVGLVKMAKKTAMQKRKKRNGMCFNSNLDPVERKSRNKIRDARRKARGLKPLNR